METINIINMKLTKIACFLIAYLLSGCSIIPGMGMPGEYSFSEGRIFETETGKYINVEKVDFEKIKTLNNRKIQKQYTVSPGDVITVVIWGQQEFFSMQSYYNSNNPMNSRTIDADGTIFFPFVGIINVEGFTVSEVRDVITSKLSENFIDPQVDVTVTKYNKNRNIYLVGEFVQPKTMTIGIEEITLADAIADAKGLRETTARSDKVFIIRLKDPSEPKIYEIDLSKGDKMILASEFFLEPKDIIYVGPADVTKWNRVISQFFPFASFLNQVEQIGTN